MLTIILAKDLGQIPFGKKFLQLKSVKTAYFAELIFEGGSKKKNFSSGIIQRTGKQDFW